MLTVRPAGDRVYLLAEHSGFTIVKMWDGLFVSHFRFKTALHSIKRHTIPPSRARTNVRALFFFIEAVCQNQSAIDILHEIFQYICGYRNYPVMEESDSSMKNLLTVLRQSRITTVNSRVDAVPLIMTAAYADFEQMLTADLLGTIEELNRPLLLSEVRIQGSWYAITARGLCVIEQRRHAGLAQNGSVHNISTWERASQPVDNPRQFFEKFVRCYHGNPVAAVASVQSKIHKLVAEPSFKLTQTLNRAAKRASRMRVQAV